MVLKIPEAIGQLYSILEPFSPEERQRIITSVSAALGDWEPTAGHLGGRSVIRGRVESSVDDKSLASNPEGARFGKNFNRWLTQQQVSLERLLDLFHIEDGKCTYIGTDIPGASAKVKTINCYLLAGLCAFVTRDEPMFIDADAVALCKKFGFHDPSNHSSYRKQGGNYFTGDKDKGFTLTVPGVRAVAELVRSEAS